MKLELDTRIENVETLTDAVNEMLDGLGCPRKARAQIDIALDELFSNVAHYAYGEDVGKVWVEACSLAGERGISITLEDEGVPFDPLAHEDPDVTLGVAERSIGGLGIFLVRRTMDDMRYERRGDRNRLTITRTF